ncbi:MAG TPA: prepilin-type N-terminal cleavage/methylation domain-containing protein [Myxococcota bacterium]|nr:prepilin-type N-terminal cleavage/methylation domain-containing protein [Myxococcota bacterium]
METKTIRGCASVARGQGFTLIELMTVVAILGILALMAGPNMIAMYSQQETKQTASQMAGLLSDARTHAVSEGTPYLVYFNAPTVDSSGNCGAVAVTVKDVDHSYTITPGDVQQEFHLPSSSCQKVQPYAPTTAPANLAAVPMPNDDLASRAPDATAVGAVALRVLPNVASTLATTATSATTAVVGAVGSVLSGGSGSSGSDSSGSSGSSDDGSSQGSSSGSGGPAASTAELAVASTAMLRSSTVAETVVDGATFPIDPNSGKPVIAFSERGIPVNPSDPTSIGSGAGGIYLTDGDTGLSVAIVAPLGDVQVKTYDLASNSWK